MNSFILMATVIRNPELRFTSDRQTPVCQLLVEFPGTREDGPKSTIKVVGWGNMANTINESYRQGDRLLIEGRLNINTVDRPEGFKEKRAELVASRIHRLDGSTPTVPSQSVPSAPPTYPPSPPQSFAPPQPFSPPPNVVQFPEVNRPEPPPYPPYPPTSPPPSDPNLDDIPF